MKRAHFAHIYEWVLQQNTSSQPFFEFEILIMIST